MWDSAGLLGGKDAADLGQDLALCVPLLITVEVWFKSGEHP